MIAKTVGLAVATVLLCFSAFAFLDHLEQKRLEPELMEVALRAFLTSEHAEPPLGEPVFVFIYENYPPEHFWERFSDLPYRVLPGYERSNPESARQGLEIPEGVSFTNVSGFSFWVDPPVFDAENEIYITWVRTRSYGYELSLKRSESGQIKVRNLECLYDSTPPAGEVWP